MKLLINEQLTLTYLYDCQPESFEEDASELYNDFLENEIKILQAFNVDHAFINNYTSCNLILYPQKVTLDEVAMNTLFSCVLQSFDTPYNIRYVCLGYMGCDFSFELFI